MHLGTQASEPPTPAIESETESLCSEKPQRKPMINLMDQSAGLAGNTSSKPVKAVKRQPVIKKSLYLMCMRKIQRTINKFEQRGKENVLSINSPHKTNWDLIVMFLATYNCF